MQLLIWLMCIRLVRAKAADDYGKFEVFHDISDITSVAFLNKVGKKQSCSPVSQLLRERRALRTVFETPVALLSNFTSRREILIGCSSVRYEYPCYCIGMKLMCCLACVLH